MRRLKKHQFTVLMFLTALLPIFGLTSCVSRDLASKTDSGIYGKFEDYAQRDERPDILRVKKHYDHDRFAGSASELGDLESYGFKKTIDFAVAGALEILRIMKEKSIRQVFIFARDGELVYDALKLAAEEHEGARLLENINLLEISRSGAQSPFEYVDSHLVSKKFDWRQVSPGSQAMWVDTGRVGSIYHSLLRGILLEFRNSEKKSGQIALDISVFVQNFHPYLFHLENGARPNWDSIVEDTKWGNGGFLDSGFSVSQLVFNQIDLRTNHPYLGIPRDSNGEHRWIVDYVEHVPHWRDRSTGIAADGKPVSNVSNQYDRNTSLMNQIALVMLMKQGRFRSEFREFVQEIERLY